MWCAVASWLVHSTPDSSPGRGHCVVFLGKTLYSQCLSPPIWTSILSRVARVQILHYLYCRLLFHYKKLSSIAKRKKALFRILKINMVYILSFVVYIRRPLLFWGLGHYLTIVSRRLVNGAGRALLHLGKWWSGYILGDPGAFAQKFRIVPTNSSWVSKDDQDSILCYYMAQSHKDWELPNSRIWLAEIDIDSGIDFPI